VTVGRVQLWGFALRWSCAAICMRLTSAGFLMPHACFTVLCLCFAGARLVSRV
jgi:hypothetical protein